MAGLLSLIIYYLSILGLNTQAISIVFQNEARGIVYDLWNIDYAWILIIMTPLIALLPDYTFLCCSQIFSPNIITKFRLLSESSSSPSSAPNTHQENNSKLKY